MELIEVLQQYFRGEKALGVALVPVGLVVLGFVVYLWRTESGGFMWGLVVPLALFGVLGVGGGAVLAVRTDRQVEELERRYEEDRAAVVRDELVRMERVNANWPRLKVVWTVMAVLGLVGIWGGPPWAKGLGLGVLALAAVLMMVDVFAERRAEVYTEALRGAG